MQLLRLPHALQHLSETSPTGRPIPFIYDASCRDQVDASLGNAAQKKSPTASPAILAWSIILQTLRERLSSPISDPSSDDDSNLPASQITTRHDTASASAGFTAAFQSIVEKSCTGDLIDYYARAAVDGASVLSVIDTLSQILPSVLGISFHAPSVIHASFLLFELTRQALIFTTYSPDIVATVLAVLNIGKSDSDRDTSLLPIQAILAQAFTHDSEIFVPRLLHQAQMRYPYELSPFLKLCAALAISENSLHPISRTILPLADPTSYFTQQLPDGFVGYQLTREDENANAIRLTEDLPLFLPRRAFMLPRMDGNATQALMSRESAAEPLRMILPAGTVGVVIADSRPLIVAWEHTHQALHYLGCLLSSMAPSSGHKEIANDGIVDRNTMADIIALVTRLILATEESSVGTNHRQESFSPAIWVLADASEYVGRNQDIVSVIFEIYEHEISIQSNRTDDSVDLLKKCLSFFVAMLRVVPSRIWSLLARSLSAMSEREGKMATLLGGLDRTASQYDITLTYLALYDSLMHYIVAHVALENDDRGSYENRFDLSAEGPSGLPLGQINSTLLYFTKVMLSILEETHSWPTELADVGHAFIQGISQTFSYVTSRVYRNGNADLDHTDDLCGAIAPSAKLIVDTFLSPSESDLASDRLLCTFSDITADYLNHVPDPQYCSRMSSVLEFLTSLHNISFYVGPPSPRLAKRSLKILPLLIRSFAARESTKSLILDFLSTMVSTAGIVGSQRLSLLEHLGAGVAIPLVHLFMNFGQPLGQIDVEERIWNLATVIVQNKQQWLSCFFIIGDIPSRSPLEAKKDCRTFRTGKSLLSTALHTLADLREYHSMPALAMLKFVAQSQTYFPQVSSSIHHHDSFLSKILLYVANLRTELSSEELVQTAQTFAASFIADVLAIYLHNLRHKGVSEAFEPITSSLGFYRDNALGNPDYNTSLHANLSRNFISRFPKCAIGSFRQRFAQHHLSRGYCYDLTFAEEVLGRYKAWRGVNNDGFKPEFVRANTNLALVESQMLLMRSWESLVVELSQNLSGNQVFQKHLVNLVGQCLRNNCQLTSRENNFELLLQQRAEIGLVVLQRLIKVRCEVASIKTLLRAAWNAIRNNPQSPESPFTASTSSYYRTNLQILLLAVQPYTYLTDSSSTTGTDAANPLSTSRPDHFPPEIISILHEIVSDVVCKGFCSLCSELHNGTDIVDPSDFILLVGVLQSILRIPRIGKAYGQLALRVSDTGVHRYALALFSWSDRLLADNTLRLSDPLIFADVSISFLRELSNVSPLAEFLATEGILSQLANSPVLSHLLVEHPNADHAVNSGRSATPPPYLCRLQTIWSRSILPLVLNIFLAVGPSFMPEVTKFLAAFPSQITRATRPLNPNSRVSTKTFAPPDVLASGSITLLAAAEIHTLCMIDYAIEIAQNSPTGVAGLTGIGLPSSWDRVSLKEDLEVWLGGSDGANEHATSRSATGLEDEMRTPGAVSNVGKREALRERIEPTSEWEEELLRTKANGNSENMLEEAIVTELRGALACLSQR